jgi:hypothetical protein
MKQLNEQLVKKTEELNEFQTKYKIQVRGTDEESQESSKEQATSTGILV